jgi:hypothetical protein
MGAEKCNPMVDVIASVTDGQNLWRFSDGKNSWCNRAVLPVSDGNVTREGLLRI